MLLCRGKLVIVAAMVRRSAMVTKTLLRQRIFPSYLGHNDNGVGKETRILYIPMRDLLQPPDNPTTKEHITLNNKNLSLRNS